MRVLLTGILTALTLDTASAQTVMRREPHYLPSRAVVFVSDGRCTAGMVMKVTGRSKSTTRRKACVSLRERTMPPPEIIVANPVRSNSATVGNAALSLAPAATVSELAE